MNKFKEFLALSSESQSLNPYIISEIGVNHGGDMNLAKKQIDQAARAGSSCAKFQSYKADKIAAANSPAYWDLSEESTKSQHELFKKYDGFGPDDYNTLAVHCKKMGVDFMSTPFDVEAVKYLDRLQNVIKIASADLNNKELLQAVSKKNKPIILSVGAASDCEIQRTVDYLNSKNIKQIILLHCVLNYPTDEKNANLARIKYLAEKFPDLLVGYSDHVRPDETMSAVVCAIELGAKVIEKHFTHDKSLPGNDHYHAMDEHDLTRLVAFIDNRKKMRGSSEVNLINQEDARKYARRGLYAKKNILPGEKLDRRSIIAKRPPGELDAWLWDQLDGRLVVEEIKAGDEIRLNSLSNE